ncbi:MAG: hypothetical protein ABR880_21960 [Candidatus Sulfotelmatobacter sp.]|jgi:hypothetical protein
MKKTLVLLFALVGTIYAQVANHEPGETLTHFRTSEKDTPSDYVVDPHHDKTDCIESLKRDIARIMHEKYEEPVTCTMTPWNGKTYLFRHDILVKIEVTMRVPYNEAIGILMARYGKPVGHSRVFELRDHDVINEKTYWHVKNFGVWALDMSYVSEEGNSGRYISVIVEADSEHASQKVNPKF